MDKSETFKKRYDQIAIPEELNIRIQQEIQNSRKQHTEKRGAVSRIFKNTIRSMSAAAVAVCLLFTTALNTSPVLAKAAEQLPVIGWLAQILTFRSYETEPDDRAVSVENPND